VDKNRVRVDGNDAFSILKEHDVYLNIEQQTFLISFIRIWLIHKPMGNCILQKVCISMVKYDLFLFVIPYLVQQLRRWKKKINNMNICMYVLMWFS
jgi:hypothetical protein